MYPQIKASEIKVGQYVQVEDGDIIDVQDAWMTPEGTMYFEGGTFDGIEVCGPTRDFELDGDAQVELVEDVRPGW